MSTLTRRNNESSTRASFCLDAHALRSAPNFLSRFRRGEGFFVKAVIPAQAGIQFSNILLKKVYRLDSRLRGNDGVRSTFLVIFTSLLFILCAPLRASTISADNPEDKILSKAFAAYMDGKDKQALGYFEEAARIDPHNKAAQSGLDKVKERLRKKDAVEKEKALVLAKAKVKEAREFLKSNDVIGAIDSLHSALDAVPGYKPAQNELNDIKSKMTKAVNKKTLNISSYSFYRGGLAYLDRDWARAYRIWSERSKMDPTNVALSNATARAENNFKKMMLTERQDFFRRGGRAFYEQGMYAQSKNAWEKVLELNPDDVESLEGKARAEQAILLAQGKGRDDETHDLLEQGLEYYANQNWQKALVVFKQLVQINPEFSTANDYIAKLNEKLASSDYNPGVGSRGDSWRHQQSSNQNGSSVQVSEDLGHVTASKTELESQLKRDPGNIRIQQDLDKINKKQDDESERIYKDGLIAYSQGNRAVAIQKWKEVLVVNPEHKKAIAALKKAKAEEERSDVGANQ
jgi:tetratricopeptide (TPR) repeat protein